MEEAHGNVQVEDIDNTRITVISTSLKRKIVSPLPKATDGKSIQKRYPEK